MNPGRLPAALLAVALAAVILVPAPALALDEDTIELVPVESTLLQLSTVVPADWEDRGSGTYVRGRSDDDLAVLATQPAALPLEQLWPAILRQLGLTEAPDRVEVRSTDALEWSIYAIELPFPPVSVHLGVAEVPGMTYVVLLQSAHDEHEALVEQVFDPAVAALVPLRPGREADADAAAYAVEEVRFPGGDEGVELAGSLSIPAGKGPHPAIVLLNGSGAQDRDSSFRPVTELDPFLKIADALTSAGVAVLRYDDRGTGASVGNYVEATIEGLTADATAAVDLLASRPDIDPERIGVLGHSEGTIYTAALAADDARVAFAVAMAPPAVDGLAVILAQQEAILRSMGMPEDEIAETVEINRLVSTQALAGDLDAAEATVRDVLGERWDDLTAEEQEQAGEREAFIDRLASSIMPSLQSDYMRSFMVTDPGADWSRVTIPVLGLFADKDIQALLDQNEPALRSALEAAGNEDFEIAVIPDSNHLFQEAETGYLDEYATLAPEFHPDLLPILVGWVTAHVAVSE